MAITPEGVFKYDVYFVKTGNSSEETCEMLNLAFEAINANPLKPIWISAEDCVKLSKNESALFVMDPFEGVAFEHLKNLKCPIMGPLSILYCAQHDQTLPLCPYPVYSVSMRKITVCCSNIKQQVRDEIRIKVQLMGGFFCRHLTINVTHLVVGEVGSEKYKIAASFGIPILTPGWIADLWENGQYRQLHASDKYYDKYKCPVFKGLIICASQLSVEEETALQNVIIENGGSYSRVLKANEVSHVILSEPTGEEYRFAKSWRVICVNVKWVFDSIEAGYCRDETLYAIDVSSEAVS